MMTYVEDLHWTDKKGEEHYLEHAVIGIGGSSGLQIEDFDEKLAFWKKKGWRVAWGDQLNIVRTKPQKFTFADTEAE